MVVQATVGLPDACPAGVTSSLCRATSGDPHPEVSHAPTAPIFVPLTLDTSPLTKGCPPAETADANVARHPRSHALSTTRTFAAATFQIANDASPLVYAFQAARLAVIAEVAARVGGSKVTVNRPAPGLLIVSAHEEEMAAILAELEHAQVYSSLMLDVVADDDQGVQDFAEYLRDRSDMTVIIARQAPQGPAS